MSTRHRGDLELTEEMGETQKGAQDEGPTLPHGAVRKWERHMGRALKTNSDWAPQAEEAADMAGTPERLSCWPQALPEMDSLGSVRYWSNELVFQLFSPSAVPGDPLSCTNPSARLGFKIPPGSEPSKISTCRAGPAVEGVPGHIQTPFLPELCSSHRALHSPCAQVCSPKLPKPLLNPSRTSQTQPLPQFAAAKPSQTSSPCSSSLQLQARVLPQRFSSPGSGAEGFPAQAQPLPQRDSEQGDQRGTSGL